MSISDNIDLGMYSLNVYIVGDEYFEDYNIFEIIPSSLNDHK